MTSVIISRIWERNGRDDSDWMATFWNRETKRIETKEVGTTRFANAMPKAESEYPQPTEQDLQDAEDYLTQKVFEALRDEEDRRVSKPWPLDSGTRVVVSHPFKCRPKLTEKCRKCGGQGHWQNPKRTDDRRPCFRCDGTGQAVVGSDKTSWDHVKAGEKGEVLETAFYGMTYRDGYNKPSRYNTTTRLRLDDGRRVQCKTENLALDATPASDEVLREKARKLAAARNFARYGSYSTLPSNYISVI